jgi:hypothetical protein
MATVKPDDPCIYRFKSLTDEYRVIFIGFKTGNYNLSIFVGTDEYKTTDE